MMQDYADVVGSRVITQSTSGESTDFAAIRSLSGPVAEHPEKASSLE
jgi:hypothetical protein